MAFRKRYRRHKRSYGKKRYVAKRRFKRFQRKVRSVIKTTAERKNVDSAQSGAIDRVGAFFNLGLDGLPQGTSTQSRIGNEIEIKSINIHGYITCADAFNYFRIIVFQWRKDATSLTVPNQILFNNNFSGFTWLSFYAKEYAGDFRILKDKTFHMELTPGPLTLPFHWLIKKRFNKNIRYNSQIGGNLTVKDSIFILCISDSALSPHPNIAFESRINFVDI